VVGLLLFVLPLGLDTFAVAAALGVSRLSRRERLRVSLVLALFEAAMPLLGLVIGRTLREAVGHRADIAAIALLAVLGSWTVLHREGDGTAERLSRGRGLALLALGVSVSVDELAIGFTIGLLHLSIWLAVALIGAQAFVFAQLGLRLGARLGEALRDRSERLAGLALVGLAALFAVERLV
jgi:putative Mn2+ efflux pump MntP